MFENIPNTKKIQNDHGWCHNILNTSFTLWEFGQLFRGSHKNQMENITSQMSICQRSLNTYVSHIHLERWKTITHTHTPVREKCDAMIKLQPPSRWRIAGHSVKCLTFCHYLWKIFKNIPCQYTWYRKRKRNFRWLKNVGMILNISDTDYPTHFTYLDSKWLCLD